MTNPPFLGAMVKRLSWIMPGSIAGQIAAIIVLALILAQALIVAIFVILRPSPDFPPLPPQLSARVGTIVGLMDALPENERDERLGRLRIGPLRVERVAENRLERPDALYPAAGPLRQLLTETIGDPNRRILVDTPRTGEDGPPTRIAIELISGGWLVFSRDRLPGPPRPHWHGFYDPGPIIMATFLAISIILISLWATRRVTAPLRALAAAADRLGGEGETPPVPESGAAEVRRAARAFNAMQERLKNFVSDRTKMLAAISHDLRTPLTRLRMRTEQAVEGEARAKMLHDLAQMEEMIAAALAFLKGNAADEPMKPFDLAAMLMTLADEFTDMGHDVTYAGPDRLAIRGRSQALNRAVTNLVENAVKYGGRARLTLDAPQGSEIAIAVADDGPGISEADRERVFDPFFRLDPARGDGSAADGRSGVGLGLAIARSILRAHRGDVALADGPQGGLVAHVSLPASLAFQAGKAQGSPGTP